MVFNDIFGDDEHTAADGSYVRLLKARKWLYISALPAIAYGHGRINGDRLERLLGGIVRIDHYVIWFAVLAPLTLMTIQYGLLAWQNAVTYDMTLNERFRRIRSDKIDEAKRRVVNAKQGLRNAGKKAEEALSAVVASREAWKSTFGDRDPNVNPTSTLQSTGKLLDLDKLVELSREDKFRKDIATADDHLRKAEADRVGAALGVDVETQALSELLKGDPTERAGFTATEKAFDLVRFVPPVIVSSLAWIALFF